MKDNNELFSEIKAAILSKSNHNVSYDDTYIRRLQYYPEFLSMPYWLTHSEYIDFKQYLITRNFKGKLLDFGCGSGHMDILLARDGFNIHGVDLSPIAIDICNILRDNESDVIKQKVSFSLEDITNSDYQGDKFDLVWCCHTLEHIKDHEPIFRALRKRVSPGTKMYAPVPLGYAFNDPDHVHHWRDANDFINHFSKFVKIENVVVENKKHIIIGYFIL